MIIKTDLNNVHKLVSDSCAYKYIDNCFFIYFQLNNLINKVI